MKPLSRTIRNNHFAGRLTRIKIRLLYGLVPLALLFIHVAAIGQEDRGEPALTDQVNPTYENLFNCMCDMKVEDGEIDDSGNCGKPLANCSCGTAKRMKRELQKMDERGLSRSEQIEAFKEKYSQFNNKVLAVPDPSNNNWYLAYLVPPVMVMLGLLFVGGIGWYWLESRVRSDVAPDSESDFSPHADIDEELEREIEEYKPS